jgi:hypothetical protein
MPNRMIGDRPLTRAEQQRRVRANRDVKIASLVQALMPFGQMGVQIMGVPSNEPMNASLIAGDLHAAYNALKDWGVLK